MKITSQTGTQVAGLNVAKGGNEKETVFKDDDKVTISGDTGLTKSESCYTKEKAMSDLLRAESNNIADAMSDLKVVEGDLKKKETLDEATGQFVRLLGMEGNDKTPRVQQDFVMIGKSLKENEKRKDAVTEYDKLIKTEWNLDDARSDYLAVEQNVSAKEGRPELTDQFVKLLGLEGNDKTPRVQQDFQIIEKSLKDGETTKAAVTEYDKLIKAEWNLDDARSDYLAVDQNVSAKEGRPELTDQFVRLLGLEGNDKTPRVQQDFQMIEKSLKDGETTKDAVTEYEKVIKAEWNLDDARSNYGVIDKNVSDTLTREDLTKQFVQLLGIEGNDKTPRVQQDFQMIINSLGKGEKLSDAVNEYVKLIRATGQLDNARSDYTLVNQYVSEKETRQEVTDQFIRILSSVGSSRNSQAQEMFKQIH